MAKYPVAPRYARMLVATETSDLLPYVIIAVAALSVDELFVVRADIDAVQVLMPYVSWQVRRCCVSVSALFCN